MKVKLNNGLPIVSIGMPVYNGEQYLRETLDSLLVQDFENFELIISDNASEDSTQEICLEYANRDSRIRYYRNEKNLGACWNFNRVLQLASCEYFMWAAHDDLRKSSFISKMVTQLQRDSRISLASCLVDHINMSSQYVGRPNQMYTKTIGESLRRCVNRMLWRGYGNLIYGVFRTERLRQACPMKPLYKNYLSHTDIIFLFEIAITGDVILVPEILVHKRVGGVSWQRMDISLTDFIAIQWHRLNRLLSFLSRHQMNLLDRMFLSASVVVKVLYDTLHSYRSFVKAVLHGLLPDTYYRRVLKLFQKKNA